MNTWKSLIIEYLGQLYIDLLQYWPILILGFLAAGFRELMEHARDDKFQASFWGYKLTFNYLNTGHNPLRGRSWKNKWKTDHIDKPIPCIKKPWYYFGLFKPEYEERFAYSSTFLVPFTDGEHLFQLFSTLSVCLIPYSIIQESTLFFLPLIGFAFLGFVKETVFPQVS